MVKLKRVSLKILNILVSVVFLIGICSACSSVSKKPQVEIKSVVAVSGGTIEGVVTNETENVLCFKGVPYAAPPIGTRRWKAPQDVEPWEGVQECKEFGNSAMQSEQKADLTFTEEFIVSNKNYSEDCLTLNVWTKNENTRADRAVIVYFHGGAWVAGGSSCEIYDGEFLAEQGVVFVSVNYRLGIFGWFANSELVLENPEGSAGNYGLMDMVKSLEWVRDNIESFGGDKNNVTIMGQSAGSQLVNSLMISPKAEGLFENAVAMSYNDINSNYTELQERITEGDKLGSLETLRNTPAQDLLAFGIMYMGICKDGMYIDKNYDEALEAGRSKNINLMSGMVFNNIVSSSGDSLFTGKANNAIKGVTNGESLMGLENCISKARAIGGAKGKTYIYDFAKIMPGPNAGEQAAFHTSDVPYFLNYRSPLREDYWTEDDESVGKLCSSYLINFCKSGNPNGKGLPKWNENNGKYNYMYLDTESGERTLSDETSAMIMLTYTQSYYGGYNPKYF